MAEWTYERQKEYQATKNRQQSLVSRDIKPLPKVKNKKRRASCRLDFRLFCETYFASVFVLAWSEDHLKVIRIIEDAVLRGGLFAVAMPRGSGKTSLCIVAAEWALLYGHRSFITLIGASEDAACDLLDLIKADLESNDLLLADFPEVCYPIRRLDGITHRAAGQLLDGERTQIGLTAKELVLPTVKGSEASGARVKVAGITGRIRGLLVKRKGGTLRPDLVLIDDPQTDESARSPKQVQDRLKIVSGAVLGLAGPGKKIAGVMPVTVIAKGDMADEVLDRKKNPEWQGVRIKMMPELPTNTKLWEEYAEVRANSLREGNGLKAATEFYVEHKSELDAGAVVSWAARYNPDEASAIQHAMDLRLSNLEAFQSEYQNEPLAVELETPLTLKTDQIEAKAVAIKRGIVPAYANELTAFIDVQGNVLFYVVAAWGKDYTGHVVEYGTYPEQSTVHFQIRDLTKTLQKAKPGVSLEGQLYDGLDKLTSSLLTREWMKDGGGSHRIGRLLIDANWGQSTEVVKQFCRQSSFGALLLPSHGRGITADRKAMSEWQPRRGEKTGWNWRELHQPDHHLVYDTNAWKTFVAQRLAAAPGEPGSLSIHQGSHRLFADHVTAEYPTPTQGLGRQVNIWKAYPGRENHYLDCLVGAAVAASRQGVMGLGHSISSNNKKRRKVNVTF